MLNPVEIRLPELSGGTEAEQLRKIRSYLYSLAQQLQYALDGGETQDTAQKQWSPAALKAAILRSAELAEKIETHARQAMSGNFASQAQMDSVAAAVRENQAKTAAALRREEADRAQLAAALAELQQNVQELRSCIRIGENGVTFGRQVTQDGIIRFRPIARLRGDQVPSCGTEKAPTPWHRTQDGHWQLW